MFCAGSHKLRWGECDTLGVTQIVPVQIWLGKLQAGGSHLIFTDRAGHSRSQPQSPGPGRQNINQAQRRSCPSGADPMLVLMIGASIDNKFNMKLASEVHC